jgi:hypothetical protein
MPEWWTYSLSDFLLFSPRTYYRLLELYNLAVWPFQVVAVALGAVILALFSRGGGRQARAGSALLAACWLWVAWAYLWERYDTINWAASYFAVGFGIQSLLLAWSGVVRDELRFRAAADITTIAGLGIFLYAFVVHPLIAPLVGRPWLQAEVFAVAPDPTVVATLGLVTAAWRPHWELLVVPLIWCTVSGATLWTMQSPEAPVMPVVAAASLALAGWKHFRRRAFAGEGAR